MASYDWRAHAEECEKRNKAFLVNNNPYGYRLNVNNPIINEYYRRFLKWKSIPLIFPIPREKRLEFERYILPILANGGVNIEFEEQEI